MDGQKVPFMIPWRGLIQINSYPTDEISLLCVHGDWFKHIHSTFHLHSNIKFAIQSNIYMEIRDIFL